MPSATDAAKTLIPHGPFQYPPTQGPKHTTSRLAAPLKPITSSSAKGRHYRILPLDKQGCAGSGAPFTTQRNATQRSAPDRGGGTAQVYPTFVSPSFCIRCSGAGMVWCAAPVPQARVNKRPLTVDTKPDTSDMDTHPHIPTYKFPSPAYTHTHEEND
uniref:Uncharacterized protein n=1 Tax=Psilocybe cubensis TaxID=181762 RepID=A0A8H7XNC3_PSICU